MNNLGPRHPLAKWFVNQFKVSELKRFADLESQIAALPTKRARGDALEVFAEAWLATQRTSRARDVWPSNTAPLSLQKSLRLPLNDMGVDGLFEAAGEDPTCYQVKFRTNRPRLSWTELSTFFGLSDTGCGRLVFTNCDEIASVAEDRPGVVFVRGGDLDRLTPDDFRAMDAWLAGATVIRKTKSPRPHQEAAIVDILDAFKRQSRTTALMACATGKTLVALWVAERIGARNVLVLLPSLALVRQTLHEWLHETNWPEVEYRCVCSDPTVLPEEDALVVRQSDLDFPVTTKSDAVRHFLERPTNAIRLIFSTYQSSSVVAQAITGLPPIDFAVFDEAHKTAGLEGMKSSLALKDEQLPISRRLFLTATPRHYNLTSREKSGPARIVFSMDSTDIYGTVAHRLPFSKAARAGIITNYKIVFTVVTSEMVTNELIRRGFVIVDGEKIKARQVANQIALQVAIERYQARKIFTFHARVASAKSFVSSGSEGISTHLPEFHCDYISGDMPTGNRERRMREFESNPLAIMANARCLTEGVDVPAVDMVAFLSPRRSLVDIVQAAGRAMRRADGKAFGYVLVPLYVEESKGETIEQAVKRSNYDEAWKILNRLQEHDDLLAQIIDDMRLQRGETGGFDDSRFRERVDILGSSLPLEILRNSITAACIDAIGDPWMERYGQLIAYYKKNGNCDVPVRFLENKALATWVVAQRYERRQGNLGKDRIDLLDRIGFTWDPYNAEWRGNYLALLEFRERHGHCRVPTNSKGEKTLGSWVKAQRSRKMDLGEERIRLLDKIGFEWHSGLATWDERFRELCAFKERFGHARVPVTWKENKKLAGWIVRQRVLKRAGKINTDHQRQLNELEFEWDLVADTDEQWSINIAKLKTFSELHGHALVSARLGNDPGLGRWVERLRKLNKSNKLTVEQKQTLDALGFSWDAAAEKQSAQWNSKFYKLKLLHAKTGSCMPERGARDRESILLLRWVADQRKLWRAGKLAPDRIERLESLGFRWVSRTRITGTDEAQKERQLVVLKKTWEEMFSNLADFFKKHGHCDVPNNWPANKNLSRWVAQQRKLKTSTTLTSDQQRKLDDLGFSWDIADARWERHYASLKSWMAKRTGGKEAQPSSILLSWMNTQRQRLTKGLLPIARKEQLDAIGFEWVPFDIRWMRMMDALIQYRKQHGHCRVPQRWPDNPKLARWVETQRAKKATGHLSDERISALNALQFTWRRGEFEERGSYESWEMMYSRLVDFHSAHGHSSVPQIYTVDQKLGWWVTTQRRNRRKNKLTELQIKQLDSIGFAWKFTSARDDEAYKYPHAFDVKWQKMLAVLKVYRDQYGHCRVPDDYAENPRLGSWVAVQRRTYKKGRLRTERIRMLDSLGFEWSPGPQNQSGQSASWDEMFRALEDYKKNHGDCRVPQLWKENRKLADWVAHQRTDYKQKRITSEHKEALISIGFDWAPITSRWDAMFEQLLEYKKIYGTTNVRAYDKKYERLANWVKMQRRDKTLGRPIGATRLHRLDEIGFVWRFVEPNNWDQMFETLVEFKKRHGHCNVPQKFPEHKKFGRWVNTQRMRYKNHKLPDEKRLRLEALGFIWNTKPILNG